MSVIGILLTIALIGAVVWAINTYAGPYIAAAWLKLFNVMAFILTILWLLEIFGVWGELGMIHVPRVH